MQQLFADTYVVPSIQVGARVARGEKVNCVTIEGEYAGRRETTKIVGIFKL